MRNRLAVVLTLSSAVALAAACSSKPTPPPVTPTTAPDGGATGLAEAGAWPAPDAGAPIAAPDAGAPFFTNTVDAGTAAAPLTEAALDTVIDLALTTASPKVAPKMEKEGAAGRATLAEGGHFSMMVNLAPNRCYTFVANSPPGSVEKIDLKLFGPPFFNVEAGKSAATDKNLPVIGKGTAALCPIVPLAVPYKLDVAATKGAGRIGVQVYSRAK